MFGIKSWVPPNQQVDASHKLTVNETLQGMGHGRRYRPVLTTSLGEGRSRSPLVGQTAVQTP